MRAPAGICNLLRYSHPPNGNLIKLVIGGNEPTHYNAESPAERPLP